MKPSGIEPATFRFVAQHLNHCATAVPTKKVLNRIFNGTRPVEDHSSDEKTLAGRAPSCWCVYIRGSWRLSGGKDIHRRTMEEAVAPLMKQKKKICQYRHTAVTTAPRLALFKNLWLCRQDFL